jgi:hypothetical protein
MDALMPLDVRHRSGRRSRVVLAPRSWCQVRDAFDERCERQGQESRSLGRARITRKTIRAGRAGMSWPNLWFLPRAFFTARGPWGRQAPGLPCALSIFRGRHAAASLGRTALRACAVMSARLLQGGSERKGKRFHPSSFRGDAKRRARNPYSRSWLWIRARPAGAPE